MRTLPLGVSLRIAPSNQRPRSASRWVGVFFHAPRYATRMTVTRFQATDYIATPEDAEAYLKAAMETGDPDLIKAAEADIASIKEGD